MEFSIFQSPDQVKNYLSSVVQAADQHKTELGFLPPAAYEAQANKGRLWVLVNSQAAYMGHLMFSGHRQAIKITQLYLESSVRGEGVATLVLNALKEYAERAGCQYIQARVAADLEANAFWEKNGFIFVRQVPGSESRKRWINERAWFVPSSALFETIKSQSEALLIKGKFLSKLSSYVLDTNAILDYANIRVSYPDIEAILQKSLNQELRLRVTPELKEELSRGSSFSERDIAVRLVGLIPSLEKLDEEKIEQYLIDLLPLVFAHRKNVSELKPNEKSDLVHLAYCIEYSQSGFITRDGPVLRSANKVGIKYGIEILTPLDLVPDEVQLADHSFGDGVSAAFQFNWVSQDLVKSRIGESFSGELVAYIKMAVPDWGTRPADEIKLLQVSQINEVAGYAAIYWSAAENGWEIALSSLGSFAAGRGLIDEVLQCVQKMCRHSHSAAVSIVLFREAIEIYEQALDNGFVPYDTGDSALPILKLKRLIYLGVINHEKWPDLVAAMRRSFGWAVADRIPKYDEFVNTGVSVVLDISSNKRTFIKLQDFEKLIAPGLLAANGRPAALIPIKKSFAKQLLPEAERTQDMLDSLYAGMYSERAYFSYSKAEFAAQPGGLVVFYSSGQGPETGLAVALAKVTSISETTEGEAKQRYLSRGVLILSDTDKPVTVVTFSNVLSLINPVPYSWMKENGIIGGANLVTAQEISNKNLLAILNYEN